MKIIAWGLSSLVASVRAWGIQLGHRETGALVLRRTLEDKDKQTWTPENEAVCSVQRRENSPIHVQPPLIRRGRIQASVKRFFKKPTHHSWMVNSIMVGVDMSLALKTSLLRVLFLAGGPSR